MARFQRTLADGRIGCFIRLGLCFNQLVKMARMTKKTARKDQYRAILEKDGIRFEDCRVLSFVFEYPIKTELFHYGLMAEKPDYYIFDCWDKNANVVVPKDKTNDAHITLIAEQLGGQKTMANLR